MRARRIAATSLVLVLAGTVVGCEGDDDPKGSASTPSESPSSSAPSATADASRVTTLTEDQLEQILVAVDDLGPGFVVNTEEPTDKTKFGCLEPVGVLAKSDLDASAAEELKFKADSRFNAPNITSRVRSFDDVDAAVAAAESFEDAVEDCESVDVTNKTGFRVRVDIESEESSESGLDSRFTVSGTGTGTVNKITFPYVTSLTVVRYANVLVLSTYTGFGDEAAAEAPRTADLAIDRFLDVLDGDEPDPDPLDLHVTTERDLVGSDVSS